MRYIELSNAEKETLKELHKNHKNHRTRIRGHMLLLSGDGFRINEIARIHQVKRDTVSQCFDNWEHHGIVGLYDEPKSGRPRELTEEEVARGLDLLKEDPRGSKQAQSCLVAEGAAEVSEWTFKRALKRAGLRWKRMRRSVRHKRDEEAFAQAAQEIAALQQQEDQGELDLYYFDESGVSLTPSVPYGWQEAGVTMTLPSSRSKRLNILGFCNRKNDFHATTVEGWVTSHEVIACFDAFSETLTKATMVMIDNASIHRSEAFCARLDHWATKGLTVKHLPTYSPELNLIEIVWRFIKYQWLPLSAFQNYKTLKQALQDVLDGIGSKYLISFA
jgi:transposase